jgi:hypothetical protein
VAAPKAIGSFLLACLTRYRYGLGEVGRGFLALEDRLSGNACRRRCFPDRASFFKFSEDNSAAPVEFHGVRLPETRLGVYLAWLGAGSWTTGGEKALPDYFPFRGAFSCAFLRFRLFF